MSAVGARALKLVGQLAGNPRAALGQLDGSKQVAALVGARAPARILEPPCRAAPLTVPLEPEAPTASFRGGLRTSKSEDMRTNDAKAWFGKCGGLRYRPIADMKRVLDCR